MRKFFVVICLICLAHSVSAHPNHYAEPSGTTNYASSWNFTGSTTYSNDIGTVNYPKIKDQLCQESDDKCKDKVKKGQGTYDDERAIVLDIAREIYRNGAKFCTTQIQGANKNGRQYTWVDYYSNTNYDSKCKVYCKPGFDPATNCEDPIDSSICEEPDYGIFVLHDVIGSGGEDGRITDKMELFSFLNETGRSDQYKPVGEHTAKHVVLGIIKNEENQKGVIVGPIEITAKRGGNPHQSWIYSAKFGSNTTVLCPQGYVANQQAKKCEPNSVCAKVEEEASIVMCSQYATGYNETDHTRIYNDSGKCWEYKCKLSGYGFKSDTDKTCEKCGTDVRSGALRTTGVCTTCPVSQCLKNGECGGCIEIPKLKIERGPNYDSQNRECWRKTNPDKFWGCVMCPDENQCYNKNSSGKYECGTCPTE